MIRTFLLIPIFTWFCTSALYAQEITDVSPDQGHNGDTLNVTVSGQNTNFSSASSTNVIFSQGTTTTGSNIHLRQIQVQNDLSLTGKLALQYYHDTGYYNAIYMKDFQRVAVKEDAFKVLPDPNGPKITSVTPKEGAKGDTLSVTISGQNTNFSSASTTEILFDQGTSTFRQSFSMTDIQINNSQELEGKVALHSLLKTGDYNVTYRKNFRSIDVKENGFKVKPNPNPPEITSIDPNKGKAGNSLSVAISGSKIDFEQGTTTNVVLTDENLNVYYQTQDVSVQSSNEATVNMDLPSNIQAGLYDFAVTIPVNSKVVIKKNGFYVEKNGAPAPEIQSIGTDTVVLNQSHQFEISFTSGNLFENSDSTEVMLDNGNQQMVADQVGIIDQRTIEPFMDVPFNAQTGLHDLVVMYGGGFELRQEDAVYVKDENSSINNEPNSANEFTVYPNPVNDKFHFQLDIPKAMNLKAEILNNTGQSVKKVFDQKVNAGKKEFKNIAIDGNLPSGTYILKITSESGSFERVARIQKQ